MRLSDLYTLASALTLGRLAIAASLPWLEPTPWLLPAYGVALLTDVLDGMVARRTGTASEAGAVLDAWCDKILHVNLALVLVVAGRFPAMWMAALFAREILQATMILPLIHRIRLRRGPLPATSALGRVSTVLVAVVLALAILGSTPTWLVAVTGAASIAAGLQYGWIHRPWRRRELGHG